MKSGYMQVSGNSSYLINNVFYNLATPGSALWYVFIGK